MYEWLSDNKFLYLQKFMTDIKICIQLSIKNYEKYFYDDVVDYYF